MAITSISSLLRLVLKLFVFQNENLPFQSLFSGSYSKDLKSYSKFIEIHILISYKFSQILSNLFHPEASHNLFVCLNIHSSIFRKQHFILRCSNSLYETLLFFVSSYFSYLLPLKHLHGFVSSTFVSIKNEYLARAYPKTLSNPLLSPTFQLPFQHYIGFGIGSSNIDLEYIK
jgi:hypothetical protein